jgi:hypothetical protein
MVCYTSAQRLGLLFTRHIDRNSGFMAWQLFGDYLNPKKRLVAPLIITFIPFFNFHALKFNVNTLLMPLWAVTTFWFLRSFKTCSSAYAALAGVGAAFCMVSKYWSICLLGGLVVAALSDSRRGVYFRSPAPWITVLTTIAVLSPHIGWLEKHNFSPMDYAMAVHGGHSFGDSVWAAVRYSIAFVSVPIAVVLLASRPSLRTIADMAWPAQRDRRLVAVAFWATLLLPLIPATLWGVEINGIWSMSSWTLLPVLLLSSPSVQVPPLSTRWIAGSAVALPVVMLTAAPVIAYLMYKRGLPPELLHSRMLAEKVELALALADGDSTALRGRRFSVRRRGLRGRSAASPSRIAAAHDRPSPNKRYRTCLLLGEGKVYRPVKRSRQINSRQPKNRGGTGQKLSWSY